MLTIIKSQKKISVLAECEACNGTGLYVGILEAKGEAVACYVCNGTGCLKIVYKPFVRQKIRRGIKKVRLGSTGLITKNLDYWVSYRDWKKDTSLYS